MTPEQIKARELVDAFYQICSVTIAGTATIFRQIAKQAAIKCVDEILKYNEILLEFFPQDEDGYKPTFWKDVKKEIELL